jgi:hypothetical protein
VDLITISDIEIRAGRTFTATETGRIAALIQDASAAIRLYCGRPFGVATATVRRVSHNGTIELRRRDITAVTAVTTTDAVTVDHEWDGLHTITVSNPWRFDYEYPTGQTGTVVDITYTHGTATIPDVVTAVACQVVARAFGIPADQTGMQQESIGGYSYTTGSAAAAGPVGLLPAEMRALDAYRAVGGTARTYVR